MKKNLLPAFVAMLILGFSACKKSSEDFQPTLISDYAPLEIGKYVVYNLDSTVFINFGQTTAIHSYQVKYQVDAAITDNLGRPAYRIFRYIRNTPTAAWTPDNSFTAVNTGNVLEFIENNMRFVKLSLPIKDNYSWKGNTYIDTYSANSLVRYLDDWDYTYDSVGAPLQIGGFSFDKTITVNERDEVVGFPNDPTLYSEINFSQEKYAYGIGLIYRKFFHSEYQPPVPGVDGHFVEGSYGITMTIADHN